MKYKEACEVILRGEFDTLFSVEFSDDYLAFHVMELNDETDDEGNLEVSIIMGGGQLFSSSGEEEYYTYRINDEELLDLEFYEIQNADPSKMHWFTSDHVLYHLFPFLPDPSQCFLREEYKEFTKKAHLAFSAAKKRNWVELPK